MHTHLSLLMSHYVSHTNPHTLPHTVPHTASFPFHPPSRLLSTVSTECVWEEPASEMTLEPLLLLSSDDVQGYLDYKKPHRPRTVQ